VKIDMLKRPHIFLFLIVFLASCTLFPAATPPKPATAKLTASSPATTGSASFLGLPWDDAALFTPGLVKSQQDQYSSIRGASVYHLALEIAADMLNVKGREEVRYTNRETTALDKVEFRLFPNLLGGKMTIANLTVDGQPVTPEYDLGNSLMSVPLALQPGDSCIIRMDFALSVPTNAEQNYGVLALVDNVLTLAHSYPMIPVYDEQGWHAEIPPQWGDLTYTDAAYFVVRVTAPAEAMLIASGQQVSNEKTDQTQTALFALGPGRDFMLVAAKGYEVQTRQVGETTVNSYAPVAFHKRATLVANIATEAVHIFNKRYATYPYTELDVVATPTLAFGVEYPGLVAITNRIYGPGDTYNNAPIEIYLESTVAHETGHQWFYNLVGDDQLNQPWLDESLTQFATWQYYADRYGAGSAEGFKQSLESRWARVDNAKIPVGQPVAAYDGTQYGAIVYGRGALFFFALRDQMGQDDFDTFLKDYTQQYTWETATADRLKSLAEKDCDCDLSPLFKEWITP
jgi:hypothetical protein